MKERELENERVVTATHAYICWLEGGKQLRGFLDASVFWHSLAT